ncbi:S24/S26 family peptidase [Nocardioides coralli]|uniref:S24/S26 family peptidase n=1 Tax=Nocardioides coralli TaxID=2872154 RepID=UPI001CA39909|nr:S24/S26 family peptidase [Nocardioides coralli]QZY30165.1 S24/S26 family peptidase [Nocardioides coralli]
MSLIPFGIAVVRGTSMLPGLRDGDRLLVRYGAAVRPGAVVVGRFADGTLAVKRAAEQRPARDGSRGWWLLGDNPDGLDSRHRGPVPETDVLGVAVARVWPRPRGLRPR